MIQIDKKIVLIGGGTGSFTLLSGLKGKTKNLTALINMADDGGSSGILRDELGGLPPGDVRQCLVALSESPRLRELFNYRFEEGSLKGHSFGNLFLSAMEQMTNSFPEAVELASEVLRVQGDVLPITTEKSHLVLNGQDGDVEGQYKISRLDFKSARRPQLSLSPSAAMTDEAGVAIAEADVVIIAPGNLYASLAPALLVDGVSEALQHCHAKIIYVCNLVTKPHQTDNFTVSDYAAEIERFIGAPVLDYVIYNTKQPIPSLLTRYTHEGEFIVTFDKEKLEQAHYQAIGLSLVDTKPLAQHSADAINQSRTLIRHDSSAIASEILKLATEKT